MRLRKIVIQQFRNIPFARLELSGRRQCFVGANGQGKTNLLEAAGCLAALRSFRAADPRAMIAHGQDEAAIACKLDHERGGETIVTIKLRADGKEVWIDQERVARLADYIGRFPMVALTAQDLQLIRGTPSLRRRWLDLTLSAMDAVYLRELQAYHRALAERNALLKQGGAADEIEAFEKTMAPSAAALIEKRASGLGMLASALTRFYAQIADAAEPAAFAYAPDFREASPDAVAAMLAKNRPRDMQFRTTLCGPHRDDFSFLLTGRAAGSFASEGQQRSLVLALRLAQSACFYERGGVRPILLADDVLGELDPARRERFWSSVDEETQVLATGTSLPAGEQASAWQVFAVSKGAFLPFETSA